MKRIIIGIVLVLGLGAVTVYVTKNEGSSTIRNERSDFAIQDTASITQIILKDEAGTRIELTKNGNKWILNGAYSARPDAVDILLTTMKKVTVRAPISEQMMNTVNKNIISSHTLVEAYAGSELIKSYYVGGPDKEHTGTFMLMKGSSRPFLMHIEGFHGFLTPRFFTNELEWRNRAIFEYEPKEITSIDIEYMEKPGRNISIHREGKRFDVSVGSPLAPVAGVDSFMLSAYLKSYELIHFESFEETKTEAFLDSIKQSTPIFKLRLTDRNQRVTEIQGFRKPLKDGYDPEGNEINYDMDRLYLWIDSKEMVIGQYAILDKLTNGINFIDPV